MSFHQYVSIVLVIVSPISAMMLAKIVLQYKVPLKLDRMTRAFASLLVVAFILQAAGQLKLLADWQEPRTSNWVLVYIALHGLIWSAFWKATHWKGHWR